MLEQPFAPNAIDSQYSYNSEATNRFKQHTAQFKFTSQLLPYIQHNKDGFVIRKMTL